MLKRYEERNDCFKNIVEDHAQHRQRGQKVSENCCLQTSNSMDKILNLINGKQVVARRT